MNKVCVFSAPGGLRGAPGVCAQGGGAARGPHRGVPQCCSLWVFCGPPLLAKKRNISGVLPGSCGFSLIKEGSNNKFYGCGVLGGCAGRLGCAAGWGLPGVPEGRATLVHFFMFLGDPVVGKKRGCFFGCAWVAGGLKPFLRAQRTRSAAAVPQGASWGT